MHVIYNYLILVSFSKYINAYITQLQFTECSPKNRKYFLISNIWYEAVLIIAIVISKNGNKFGYQKFEGKSDIKKLNKIGYHKMKINFDIKHFTYIWYPRFKIDLISKMWHIFDIKLLISKHFVLLISKTEEKFDIKKFQNFWYPNFLWYVLLAC